MCQVNELSAGGSRQLTCKQLSVRLNQLTELLWAGVCVSGCTSESAG
jgi:hypothetical protein